MRILSPAILAATLGAATLAPGIGQAQETDTSGLSSAEVPMNENAPKIEAGPVPHRTMQCRLSRATNIDPARDQTEAEVAYDGDYTLTLELPATRVPEVAGVGTGQADRAPDAGYRVAADPGGLFREFPPTHFDRVADYWPKHVELGQTILGKAFQFIILEEVPGKPGTASIFISRAADAVTVDVGWLFRGECRLAGA